MSGTPEAIYIHIGHGKTGSSFLQSSLALSTEALERNGFTYPIAAETAEKARAGHITGGNLRATPETAQNIQRLARDAGGRKLLISGESFFFHLGNPQASFLNACPELFPHTPLHILCYLRDPVDHAVSTYQQKVKRGGFTSDLALHLKQYAYPDRTIAALSALEKAGAHVTVLNYSRHRDNLLATLASWLGLPEGSLTAPARGEVNRSLTLSELELQRLFNQRLGKHAGRLVSDPLCDMVPELRSETPPLARDALAEFLDRMHQELGAPAYQDLVPEAERPRVGTIGDHADRFPDPAETRTHYTFNQKQLEVLVDTLARFVSGQERFPRKRLNKAGPGRKGAGPKGAAAGKSRPAP